jgi:hypothetical protein
VASLSLIKNKGCRNETDIFHHQKSLIINHLFISFIVPELLPDFTFEHLSQALQQIIDKMYTSGKDRGLSDELPHPVQHTEVQGSSICAGIALAYLLGFPQH